METKMTVGRLGGRAAERRLNIARRRGGPQSKNKRKTCCADGVQLNARYSSRENVAELARAGGCASPYRKKMPGGWNGPTAGRCKIWVAER
jgi:hypothetical protein